MVFALHIYIIVEYIENLPTPRKVNGNSKGLGGNTISFNVKVCTEIELSERVGGFKLKNLP